MIVHEEPLVSCTTELIKNWTNSSKLWKWEHLPESGVCSVVDRRQRVNDRISIKNAKYIISTLLSFLKLCLYSCYTNPPFHWISLFNQLNIVSCKMCENHFLRIAFKLHLKFIKVDTNFRNSFQIIFLGKIFLEIHNTMQTYIEWNGKFISNKWSFKFHLNFIWSIMQLTCNPSIFELKCFSLILWETMFNWWKSEIQKKNERLV